jgi:putative sigma-54 modulation protein
MQISVRGKNLEVTPALRRHAEEKAAKLDRYLDRIRQVEFVLSHQKGVQTAEVNVASDLVDLRAQERNGDMYEAIDLVTKKLEKQVRRFKERLKEHPRNSRAVPDIVAERAAAEMIEEQRRQNGDVDEEEEAPRIARVKRLDLKPISPDEAAEQMELVDHDFYVFMNAETDRVGVLYRRNDGHYGLLEAG